MTLTMPVPTSDFLLDAMNDGRGMLMGQVKFDPQSLQCLGLGVVDVTVACEGFVNLGLEYRTLSGHLIGKGVGDDTGEQSHRADSE